MTADALVSGGGPIAESGSSAGDAELTAALRKVLDDAGFVHRLADVAVAGELAAILADLRGTGQVAESLLAEYAQSLTFSCPEEVAEPRALIVVASRVAGGEGPVPLGERALRGGHPADIHLQRRDGVRTEGDALRPGTCRVRGGAGADTGQASRRSHRSSSVRPQQHRLRPESGLARAPGCLLHRRAFTGGGLPE